MWRRSSARAFARLLSLITVLAVPASVLSAPSSPPSDVQNVVQVAEAQATGSAILAARMQGSRVAVADLRTPTREVFANPTGTLTAELSVVPTRVKQDNSWVPVDTSLVRHADGSVGPKAAVGNLALSGGGSKGPLTRLAKDGKVFALYWPGTLPPPVVDGAAATYPEVLPGIDLTMYAEANGYRQHLVIKTAEAARNPALAQLQFRVETEGLRVTVEESGEVRALDSAGDAVFVAPPSVMWDASKRSAPVGVAVRDGSLVLRPDLTFLADPTVTFPVVVDPDMRTPDKSNWATVVSGNSRTPYWWTSAAGSGVAQVGQCYNGDGDCNDIGAARAYFQFDTGFLTGRRILGSALNTVVVHSPNCSGYTHQLWRADGQITPTTSWDSAPAGVSVTEFSAPSRCSGSAPVGVGTTNIGGVTTYFLKAQDEGNQLAWRKYNPAATTLSVWYNTGPFKPTELDTDPPLRQPCRWCDVPYIADSSIRLHARLADPDNELVKPKWVINTNEQGEERWGALQVSGAEHDTIVDLDSRRDKRVRWQVQTWDTLNGVDLDASEWALSPTSFVVDRTAPQREPNVQAALYLADNRWHGGAGVADRFTFWPNLADQEVNDIDHYLWGWTSPPANKVDAATHLGDAATVQLAPPGDGPRDLFVRSVDRAGNPGPTRTYHFFVRPGNGPLVNWSLEGNVTDTAYLGDRHGTTTGAATFGPGAVGTAIELTQDVSVTAPPAVRTDTSFSVSAWVRLDEGTARRTAVSQVHSRVAGFELGYRPENGGRWVFAMPRSNVDNPVIDLASSGAPAQLGTWTHLAGVYDVSTNQQSLYVNGVLAGTATHTSRWHAISDSRIGATSWNGARNWYWQGAVDEAQIYDRVVSPVELKAMVGRDNVAAHHWRFDDEPDSAGEPNLVASNSVQGGDPGTLTNGAAFMGQGAAKGAVQLDGVNDHVAFSRPALRTDQSFSVAAWVKADRFVTGTHMTAMSQNGTRNAGFALQYNSGHQKWLFAMPSTDTDSTQWAAAASSQQPAVNQWTHVVGVYDATEHELRIYVNGQPPDKQPWSGPNWNAEGALTIGRGQWRGGPAEHWPGAIDEVRLYSRALSDADARAVFSQNTVTAGSWRLDGNANDSSGRGLHGTAQGGPTWAAGQSSMPNSADQAIQLNGSSSYVSAPPAVDPTKSFSVAAWARMDQARTGSAVVSQDAGRISVFNLHNAWDGRWVFAMRSCDAAWNCVEKRAVGTEAQAGVWVHLAGVYDAIRGQLAIFVNGALAGTESYTHSWAFPPGELKIGRATWGNTEPVDFFPGAIDDVSVYSRPLFSDEIATLAGRDPNLIHNWRLDEAGGGNAADAVGSRRGTLTGGATFGSGRVANGIRLDGVDDSVSTTGVDLRTDQSFTVAAWVFLNGNNCDLSQVPECKVDAVTIDGTRTSKFRLGHVVDSAQAVRGKWVFEMPESDTDSAPVAAALSVEPGELNTWVHLVGVYDASTNKIWLYVNGDRRDAGTLQNSWWASGGLQVGRGKVAGAAAEFWPGSVDDVRLYTGAVAKDRIRALYCSYPAIACSSQAQGR